MLKKAALTSLLFLILSLAFVPAQAQTDFREETIYFLITTRFFDGDPDNNVPSEWSSYNPDPNINPSITDPDDVTWKGDFKGLIQQLDYIKDLGFTAVWITPIVQNRSPLDYHGYHAWDFTKVDPRLESPGTTFQDLIDEAHDRDMKIILDIVTNHSGRYGIKGQAEIQYNTDPDQPWGQDSNGDPLTDNPDWEFDGLTPNPDDGKIWSRANLAKLPAPYNDNLAAYNWPNSVSYIETTDEDWFHHSGNGFAQGYDDTTNLYQRALHEDTPDLNTGSASVREYLLNAYKTFIDMGVDGFRWDTIKHMSKEDVQWFLDEFKKINPDLFIFGEVAQKRHELHQVQEINPHWYTWRGEVNNSDPSGMSVLDFFAMSTFHMFERGDAMSNVQAAARYDHLYANPSELVTFLDNHDFGPNNDWNRRFGNNAENLTSALNFMFTWRGIPSVYYGTEIQFMRGAYADIQYGGHERSLDETGRAYFGDEIEDAPDHKVYKHLKKLNAIRKAIPALQKGDWEWAGNGGYYGVGYVREYNGQTVAVGLAKDQQVGFSFSGLPNGTYRDAVTGHEVQVTGGGLTFTVAPSSAGIYVLNGPGLVGDLGAGFFQIDSNGTQTSGGGDGGGNNGGDGGGSSDSAIYWEPESPTTADQITIYAQRNAASAELHWAVNGWNLTPDEFRPEGSYLWEGTGPATRSAFTGKDGDVHSITIGPFGGTSSSITEVNFVVNYSDGYWDNNDNQDYKITLSEATKEKDPPNAPSLSSPLNGSSDQLTSIELQWTEDSSADIFFVQVSTSETFDQIIVLDTLTSDSFSLSELQHYTFYYWRVMASNEDGKSAWSDVYSFRTIIEEPESPKLIFPVNNTIGADTLLNLVWSAAARSDSFHVKLYSDAELNDLFWSGITADTSLVVSGLSLSTDYWWRVRSTNVGGQSNWSTTSQFKTKAAEAGVPELLSPANNSTNLDTTLTLTWSKQSAEVSYELELSKSVDFALVELKQSELTDTTFVLTELDLDQHYFWRARAIGASDTSGWSNVYSFRTFKKENQTPVVLKPLKNVKLNEDFGTYLLARLDSIFSDPDSEPLSYSLEYDSDLIEAVLKSDSLVVNSVPDLHGVATLLIKAEDPGGAFVMDTLKLTVLSVNDLPFFDGIPDSLMFSQGTGLSFEFGEFISDTEDELKDLIFSIKVDPASVEAEIISDPLSIYLHSTDYSGTATLTLEAMDSDSGTSAVEIALEITMVTATEETSTQPEKTDLFQNYPNPFNPTTAIKYTLAESGSVSLKVYDMVGREVAELVNEYRPAGTYSITWNASGNASGVYYFRLVTDGPAITRKMTLIK